MTWLFFGLSGRISPSVALLAGLLISTIMAIPFYQITKLGPETPEAVPWGLLALCLMPLTLWTSFAVGAKRFHDFGKPSALAIICTIGLLPFIILFFIKGDPGPNRYGAATNQPK